MQNAPERDPTSYFQIACMFPLYYPVRRDLPRSHEGHGLTMLQLSMANLMRRGQAAAPSRAVAVSALTTSVIS
jgi:hypothetical protein